VGAEADQSSAEGDLLDSQAAGSDRDRAERADERPGRKGLDNVDVDTGDPEGAQRDDQDEGTLSAGWRGSRR
jgi:hypothetical protein